MATAVTQIQYPPIDSQATYTFIDAKVTSANQTGDLQTDFKQALYNTLQSSLSPDLGVSGYSLDDLWKRYITEVVAGSTGTESGSPSTFVGNDLSQYYDETFLANASNANKFPQGTADFSSLGSTNAYTSATSYGGTVTFGGSFVARDMTIASDGSVICIADSGDNDGYHAITCSTPFVPDTQTTSTADYAQPYSFAGACAFNGDGTKLWTGGYADNVIQSGSMTTPYDLTTCTDDANDHAVTDAARATPIAFSADGLVFYVGGISGNDEIDQFTLSTAYVPDDAAVTGAGKSDGVLDLDSYAGNGWTGTLTAFALNDDGTQIIVTSSDNLAMVLTLSTAWDITSASFTSLHTGFVASGYVGAMAYSNGYLAAMTYVQEYFYIWAF